jgi:hypothetical protein
MIPILAVIQFRKKDSPRIRLWVPLILIWLLLLPIVLLLLPVFLIACLFLWLNPFSALGVFGGIFCALRGTHIDVEDRVHSFSIRII